MVIMCEQCGQSMEAPNSAVGKRVRCPSCGHMFRALLPWATVLDDDKPIPGVPVDTEPKAEERPDEQPAAAEPAAAEPVVPEPAVPEPAVAEPAAAEPAADEPAAQPAAPAEEEEYGEAEILEEGSEAIPEGIPLSPGPSADFPGRPPVVLEGQVLPAEGAPVSAPAHEPDAVQWFATTDEGEIGPLSSREVILAARKGKIAPRTVLRHSRTGVTRRAGDVPGLFKEKAKKKVKPRKRAGSKREQAPPAEPAPKDPLAALAAAAGEGEEPQGVAEALGASATASEAVSEVDPLAALAAVAGQGDAQAASQRLARPSAAAPPEAQPESPPSFGKYLLVGLWRDWGTCLAFPLMVFREHVRLGGPKIYRPLSLLGAYVVLILVVAFLGLPRAVGNFGLLGAPAPSEIGRWIGVYACVLVCGMVSPALLGLLYRLFGVKTFGEAFGRAFTSFCFSSAGLYLLSVGFCLWAVIRGAWMAGASAEAFKAPGVIFGVFGSLYGLYALVMIVCGSRGFNNWSWRRSIGVVALWLFGSLLAAGGLALAGALLLGLVAMP